MAGCAFLATEHREVEQPWTEESNVSGQASILNGRAMFLAAAMGGAALMIASAAEVQADESELYTVECEGSVCYVDKQTYIGWRTFHSECHTCHAQDAVGSTFAPSLVDRLQEIDRERFINSVANGYSGQIGEMKAYKDNVNINKRFDELYAYLKARSDGVLAPGRPKKIK